MSPRSLSRVRRDSPGTVDVTRCCLALMFPAVCKRGVEITLLEFVCVAGCMHARSMRADPGGGARRDHA